MSVTIPNTLDIKMYFVFPKPLEAGTVILQFQEEETEAQGG